MTQIDFAKEESSFFRKLLITQRLARLIRIYGHGVCIDVGCGSGSYLRLFSGELAIGVDITSEYLRNTRQMGNVSPVHSHAGFLPVRDRSVDFVLCADVLEYVELRQRKYVIREFLRICKPNGKIVVSVPNADCVFNPMRSFLYNLLYKKRDACKSGSPYGKMGEMISSEELRQYGFSVRGCLGWVTSSKVKPSLLARFYDELAWRIPRLGGTLVGILDAFKNADDQAEDR